MRPKSMAVSSVFGFTDVALGASDEVVAEAAMMMSLDVTAWAIDLCRFCRNSALATGVGDVSEKGDEEGIERRWERPLKFTRAFSDEHDKLELPKD